MTVSSRLCRDVMTYPKFKEIDLNDVEDNQFVDEQSYFNCEKRNWKAVRNVNKWEEDLFIKKQHRSLKKNYMKRLFRYVPEDVDPNERDNSKGCLVFAVVHGTGFSDEMGNKNKNYFNPKAKAF